MIIYIRKKLVFFLFFDIIILLKEGIYMDQSMEFMACIEQYSQQNQLSKMQVKKLQLVIEYFCTDITYQELSKKYNCGLSTVKRAMKDELVKEVFGEGFYSLLKGKSHDRKQAARTGVEKKTITLEECSFDEDKLLELNIIKNDELTDFSAREIKILETCLLLLKNAEKGYDFIAKKIGKSKATVSYYLNDEHLEELLKEEFYLEIKKILNKKTPAPSRLISEKKDIVNKILYYLEKENLVSNRQIARNLQIDNHTLSMYLNDNYLKELKERRKK